MRIRCGACHGFIWVQTTDATDEPALASCGDCSRQYDLSPKLKDVDLYDFQRDAHDFARFAGIELPAAYSILLGIATLGEMRHVEQRKTASGPASFDRSFADAVEAGTLSPQQAAMRGKREVFAGKLVRRHQISMERALEVADNRTPLLEAVRQGREVEQPAIESERRQFPFLRMVFATVAILVVGAVVAVVVLTRSPGETAPPHRGHGAPKHRRVIASLQEVATDVEYDSSGHATRIAGCNPEAVLDAYCRSVKGFRAEPVTLEAAGDGWNGLYRRRGVLYGITIRWDPTLEAWVAGDAVDRVRGEPVTAR